MQAPWTEIGRLESEVRDIKSSMWKYAESHKVDEVNRRVGSMEHSLREISSKVDELQSRLDEQENRLREANL